jgi:hypothetical protein
VALPVQSPWRERNGDGLGVGLVMISGRLCFPVMKTIIGISAAITVIRITMEALLQSFSLFYSMMINLSIQIFFIKTYH